MSESACSGEAGGHSLVDDSRDGEEALHIGTLAMGLYGSILRAKANRSVSSDVKIALGRGTAHTSPKYHPARPSISALDRKTAISITHATKMITS